MAKTGSGRKSRTRLSKDRLLRAAIELADESGIESLSMRKLGQELGVEAMSLYSHVANKDAIIDGILDMVVGEIELPTKNLDWKEALRRRAVSMRDVLLSHPWAAALMESRMNLGPARLRYFDAMVGILLDGGFPIELAYHANLTMDSYIYGFMLHEVSWPHGPEDAPEVIADLAPQIPAEQFPHMTAIMTYVATHPRTDYSADFEFGLELILDGLERALDGR